MTYLNHVVLRPAAAALTRQRPVAGSVRRWWSTNYRHTGATHTRKTRVVSAQRAYICCSGGRCGVVACRQPYAARRHTVSFVAATSHSSRSRSSSSQQSDANIIRLGQSQTSSLVDQPAGSVGRLVSQVKSSI